MPVTINGTTGITTPALVNGPALAFRNKIINGAMTIDQRNSGASTSFTVNQNTYTLDRWTIQRVNFGSFTIQQSSNAPAGFINSVLVTSTSSDTNNTLQNRCLVSQNIEGFNVSDLNWGTANAIPVTLSFWVRSSLTGTFGGSLQNNASDRSYPFSYSISAANTWEQKTITISGDTTGTWITNSGIGLRIAWGLGTGPDIAGAAGSWIAGDKRSATGTINVLGTNGATFYITGVQLEAGSVATPFENRPIGTELALCQRYYYRIVSNGAAGRLGSSYNLSTTEALGLIQFPVVMRAIPTALDQTGIAGDYAVVTSIANNCTFVPVIFSSGTNNNVGIVRFITTGLTVGQGSMLSSSVVTIGAWLGWSAEL